LQLPSFIASLSSFFPGHICRAYPANPKLPRQRCLRVDLGDSPDSGQHGSVCTREANRCCKALGQHRLSSSALRRDTG
jgi:hypothetical protein